MSSSDGRVTFAELMQLDTVDPSCFVAAPWVGYSAARLFGGQLIAQALRAAGATVGRGLPHSLHASFLRPASSSEPVTYTVEVLKDGRRFARRRVGAVQADRLVFTMSASFTDAPVEDLPDSRRSKVPGPDECVRDERLAGSPLATFPATDGFELRFPLPADVVPRPFQPCWVRVLDDLEGDPVLEACAIAFVSDMGLLSSAVPPDEVGSAYEGASLDHALWFGTHPGPAAWVLFEAEPVLRSGGRGLASGRITSEDGAVVAVLAQEGSF